MEARLREWCQRLITCPSVTTNGTRAVADLCSAEILAPCGISARLLPSTRYGADNVNLIAVVSGREQDLTPMVFNTHLDTVPPGDLALWTACGGDPFNPHLDGDRIYGLGTADTKLDFAAKVWALAVRRPRRTVFIIGSFGEERGLLGAHEMVAGGLLPSRGLAYVGEPSRLSVVTAHKGLMVFEVEIAFTPVRGSAENVKRAVFRGRSSHSSTPHLGENAIKKALMAAAAHPEHEVRALSGGDAVNKVAAHCEVVVAGDASALSGAHHAEPHPGTPPAHRLPHEALRALDHFIAGLERFAETSGPDEPDYAAPTLTCNPGVVRSTDRTITLEFELRPPPSLSLHSVRSGVAGVIAEVVAGFPTLRLSLREVRANPGYRAALDSEVVTMAMEAQAKAGLPLTTAVKAGCTEAGVYAAGGLTPVVFGPGLSEGNIHAPNEYNLLSEVEAAARFYAELLEL